MSVRRALRQLAGWGRNQPRSASNTGERLPPREAHDHPGPVDAVEAAAGACSYRSTRGPADVQIVVTSIIGQSGR